MLCRSEMQGFRFALSEWLQSGGWALTEAVLQTCAPRCQPCSGCRVAEQRSANLLQEELPGLISQCLWPSQGKDSVHLLCLHPGKTTDKPREEWVAITE